MTAKYNCLQQPLKLFVAMSCHRDNRRTSSVKDSVAEIAVCAWNDASSVGRRSQQTATKLDEAGTHKSAKTT